MQRELPSLPPPGFVYSMKSQAPGPHINPPPFPTISSSHRSSSSPHLVHARPRHSSRSTPKKSKTLAMENTTAPRPLLRRVLSFREPLLLVPYLVAFASAFFRSYASFLHSFARSIAVVPCAKCAYATSSSSCCEDVNAEEEEDEALRKDEVEAIMARIGLGVTGAGEGLRASLGHAEVSRLFDAEEPSFAEVRRAFAVFDRDADGLIGAADLRGALASLGFQEDIAACQAMISASCGGVRDGGMSLFQFFGFLEDGLC